MKKGLIITLPKSDLVTEYLSYFSEEIVSEAENKDVDLKRLTENEVNKDNFEKVLSKLDYNFIVFNGHGTSTSIKGHKEEILVEEGNNEIILKDRIIFARSCESGASLGIASVTKSKGCFIGYEMPFVFYADGNWDSIPGKDEVARLFLEPSNLVAISILKGHTAKEAHETAKRQTIKNIKKALRMEPQDAYFVVPGLWNNYESQVLHGNPKIDLNSV